MLENYSKYVFSTAFSELRDCSKYVCPDLSNVRGRAVQITARLWQHAVTSQFVAAFKSCTGSSLSHEEQWQCPIKSMVVFFAAAELGFWCTLNKKSGWTLTTRETLFLFIHFFCEWNMLARSFENSCKIYLMSSEVHNSWGILCC